MANLRYNFGIAALGLFVFCGELSAQSSTSAKEDTRFVAVDIFVDSKEKPLAAYQLEFSVTNNAAKIVGIEGGEHAAFAEPPFYDKQAMQRERVIIAAFSTEPINKMPTGRTRVATMHLQIGNTAKPQFNLTLHTAADTDGNKFAANATFEERRNR